MKSLKIAGLTVLFATATAYASDGIVLKYTWKKGEVTKTRMKGSLELGGQEIGVSILNQEKVVEIAADGSVTVEQSVLNLTINMGGSEQDLSDSAGAPIIAIYNADGTLKQLMGENVESGAYRVQNLMAFVPPADALKVGSKWTKESEANKDRGTPALKASYEVVGDEKVAKWDTLKIKYKIAETEGSDPASMEGTIWLNKADASPIKSDVVWTNVPMAAAPTLISGKFSSMREE
jgi:hypothetical protein